MSSLLPVLARIPGLGWESLMGFDVGRTVVTGLPEPGNCTCQYTRKLRLGWTKQGTQRTNTVGFLKPGHCTHCRRRPTNGFWHWQVAHHFISSCYQTRQDLQSQESEPWVCGLASVHKLPWLDHLHCWLLCREINASEQWWKLCETVL